MKKKVLSIGFILVLSLSAFGTTPSYGFLVESGQYSPTIFPDSVVQPWNKVQNGPSVMSIKADDPELNFMDALYLNTVVDSGLYFYRYINAHNTTDTIEVEAKLKLYEYGGTYAGGCAIDVADDTRNEVLTIYPDRIALYFSPVQYLMNTTDRYHVYKIVTSGSSFKVYIDGGLSPVIDSTWYNYGRNWVAFGDESSGGSSKSSWAYLTYTVRRN